MNNLTDIINLFITIGKAIIPFLGVLAFLVFIYGVGRFIKSSNNETDIKKTKNLLIWGVVGLFILTTIWGLISFLSKEFGFDSNIGVPQIQISNTKSGIIYGP